MKWTANSRRQTRAASSSRWNSPSELLRDPAFCRNIPYQRDDGYWMLPTYLSLKEGGSFSHDYSEVLLLNPDGSSTEHLYEIPESSGSGHGSIVFKQHSDRLLQFIRSRLADHIYNSNGSLDGSEWTPPKHLDLANDNASIRARRLAGGLLAMILRQLRFGIGSLSPQVWGEENWSLTHWPLSIALSTDDGDTLPWIRNVDTGLGFCGMANWHLNCQLTYPYVIEGSLGALHIAYSRDSRAAIHCICMKESEIICKSA